MKKVFILFVILIINLFTSIAYAHVQNIYASIAPRSIQFHIEDSTGGVTGYTPTGVMLTIPGISGYYDRTEPGIYEITRPSAYEQYHVVEADGSPNYINAGKYRVVIYGINNPIISHVSIDIRWSENIYYRVSYTNTNFLIYPNSIWIYDFDIPATPPANKQIILTKVSTPTDLIKDLTTAGQLGYIGNPKFVSELTKEINEIEKNSIIYEKDDTAIPPNQITKKEYQKLLTKITERYNKPEADKFVKEEAYTVLKEDLEYIIGHL